MEQEIASPPEQDSIRPCGTKPTAARMTLWLKMNCPKCNSELVKKFYKGMIEVESCPQCRGMWLDFHELDQLEDIVFDKDNTKAHWFISKPKRIIPARIAGMDWMNFNTASTTSNWIPAPRTITASGWMQARMSASWRSCKNGQRRSIARSMPKQNGSRCSKGCIRF
jgi:hypothetical protein